MSRRVPVAVLVGAALLVGAGATATTSGPAVAPDEASAESSLGPLAATVMQPPRPVLGTDRRRHLLYEIELINSAPVEQAVTKVVVRAKRGQVLARYDTPEEISSIMTTSTTSTPGVDSLTPNGAGYLFINVSLPRHRTVPRGLVHQIETSIDGFGEFTVHGAISRVVKRGPALLSPPLKGKG